jgi:hypothetical protein
MGAGIYEMSKGSDRQPGEFMFDPLRLAKDPAKSARYVELPCHRRPTTQDLYACHCEVT